MSPDTSLRSRPPLPQRVVADRLIAVIRGKATEETIAISDALAEVGVGVLEVTMNSPNALQTVRALAARMPDSGMVAGAGTVMTALNAHEVIEAGAAFMVTPHFDEGVIDVGVDAGVPVICGAFTATEVARAWRSGASAVKVFPADPPGPGYLVALRAPLNDIPLVPTGGISDQNVSAFIGAGATAVGVGGWLTAPGDLETVRARGARLLEQISASR